MADKVKIISGTDLNFVQENINNLLAKGWMRDDKLQLTVEESISDWDITKAFRITRYVQVMVKHEN